MRKLLLPLLVIAALGVAFFLFIAPSETVVDEATVEDEVAVDDTTESDSSSPAGTSAGIDYGLLIDVADKGTIAIDLFEDVAPLHVEQITKIAKDGSYDGVVFHRVIDGFMAQTGDVENGKAGGDLLRAGTGGSQYDDIPAEFSDKSFERGVVGMARSQNPNSANSQFFIMFEPGTFLNGQYTVVGEVTSGMDVVDAITRGDGQNGAFRDAKQDVMTDVRVTE